jgi:uncharacterized protein
VSVFVDTPGSCAVLDGDDARHAGAARAWRTILDSQETVSTTNYVIVETTALLQNRIGMDAARLFAADILPVIQVIWVDEGLHRSAMHALLVAGQRRLSLVDCVSFEAMRARGIETAFCVDPHFAEQGFRTIPETTSARQTRRG